MIEILVAAVVVIISGVVLVNILYWLLEDTLK